jgi:hypothetical protein
MKCGAKPGVCFNFTCGVVMIQHLEFYSWLVSYPGRCCLHYGSSTPVVPRGGATCTTEVTAQNACKTSLFHQAKKCHRFFQKNGHFLSGCAPPLSSARGLGSGKRGVGGPRVLLMLSSIYDRCRMSGQKPGDASKDIEISLGSEQESDDGGSTNLLRPSRSQDTDSDTEEQLVTLPAPTITLNKRQLSTHSSKSLPLAKKARADLQKPAARLRAHPKYFIRPRVRCPRRRRPHL